MIALVNLASQLQAQSTTYNPTALTDYTCASDLYLSTYKTCKYDTVPFSGVGTNTAPAQHNTDSLAAAARVVPLDSTGAACSGPPYAAGCNIVMVFIGPSLAGRSSCYGTAVQSSTCLAESYICR